MSAEPEATIVTYALGSCIAVSAYDPQRKAGGMLHIILPESQLNPEKAAQNPWMFADTGIPLLLAQLGNLDATAGAWWSGWLGDRRFDLAAVQYRQAQHLAGDKNCGRPGLVSGEAVGGDISRTVRLVLNDGCFSGARGRPRRVGNAGERGVRR